MMKHTPTPPVVWVGCRIQTINEVSAKWQTLAETDYTPRAINEAMALLGVAWCWVKTTDREIWHRGREIAYK